MRDVLAKLKRLCERPSVWLFLEVADMMGSLLVTSNKPFYCRGLPQCLFVLPQPHFHLGKCNTSCDLAGL
jgi:hypothetical protein